MRRSAYTYCFGIGYRNNRSQCIIILQLRRMRLYMKECMSVVNNCTWNASNYTPKTIPTPTTRLFLQLLDCGTVLIVLYVLSPLFLCSNVILILMGIMSRISNWVLLTRIPCFCAKLFKKTFNNSQEPWVASLKQHKANCKRTLVSNKLTYKEFFLLQERFSFWYISSYSSCRCLSL